MSGSRRRLTNPSLSLRLNESFMRSFFVFFDLVFLFLGWKNRKIFTGNEAFYFIILVTREKNKWNTEVTHKITETCILAIQNNGKVENKQIISYFRLLLIFKKFGVTLCQTLWKRASITFITNMENWEIDDFSSLVYTLASNTRVLSEKRGSIKMKSDILFFLIFIFSLCFFF